MSRTSLSKLGVQKPMRYDLTSLSGTSKAEINKSAAVVNKLQAAMAVAASPAEAAVLSKGLALEQAKLARLKGSAGMSGLGAVSFPKAPKPVVTKKAPGATGLGAIFPPAPKPMAVRKLPGAAAPAKQMSGLSDFAPTTADDDGPDIAPEGLTSSEEGIQVDEYVRPKAKTRANGSEGGVMAEPNEQTIYDQLTSSSPDGQSVLDGLTKDAQNGGDDVVTTVSTDGFQLDDGGPVTEEDAMNPQVVGDFAPSVEPLDPPLERTGYRNAFAYEPVDNQDAMGDLYSQAELNSAFNPPAPAPAPPPAAAPRRSRLDVARASLQQAKPQRGMSGVPARVSRNRGMGQVDQSAAQLINQASTGLINIGSQAAGLQTTPAPATVQTPAPSTGWFSGWVPWIFGAAVLGGVGYLTRKYWWPEASGAPKANPRHARSATPDRHHHEDDDLETEVWTPRKRVKKAKHRKAAHKRSKKNNCGEVT